MITREASKPARRQKSNFLSVRVVKGPAILLGLAAVGVLAGCALTSPHGRTTADPFALARCFDRSAGGFDYQGFCKELHLRPRMFARAEDDPPIAADVLTLEALDASPWRMIVVRNGWNSEWQYLLFSPDRQGWRLVGHIDVPAQPYVEPGRRLERASDGRAWLVLTYVACWGTGVYDRKEAWYSLGRQGVKLEKEAAAPEEE